MVELAHHMEVEMLGKILMSLGAAAFALGFWEAQSALDGSHRSTEAGWLMIVGVPVLAVGILIWRRSIKKCPACAETIKRNAKVCKHCHSATGVV
jgi:uncharacterized membrane protein YiaA